VSGVPAIDPDTLEPVSDPYPDDDARPLADAFGGEDAYREGLRVALDEAGA